MHTFIAFFSLERSDVADVVSRLKATSTRTCTHMLIINATPADSLNLSQVIIIFFLFFLHLLSSRAPFFMRTEAVHLVTVPYHFARSAVGALDARICFLLSKPPA